MAKRNNNNEAWMLITSVAMISVLFVFFLFLFPDEVLSVVSQYIWYILISLVVIIALSVYKHTKGRLKETKQQKIETKLAKQIKLAEQLIWRSRYSLQATKMQIIFEDNSENRALWQKAKYQYAKEKIYHVVSEKDLPINLVSGLIEKSLDGAGLGGTKLPTYKVKDVH